jgi:hypothetical protein
MDRQIDTEELVADRGEISVQQWPQDVITVLEELLVDEQLQEWQFFLPSPDLAKRILHLNEKLGGEYFEREYEQLHTSEEGVPLQLSEGAEKPGWLRDLFIRVSNIVFQHNEDAESTDRAGLSDQEALSLFQKFISERIYNHLAMLARSPHAKQGGGFSIHEELTVQIAEKIGLGLYLDRNTAESLRMECEATLYNLAEQFQHWFIEERKGVYKTVWAEVRATRPPQQSNETGTLILTPDVRQGAAVVATT